LSKRTVLGGRSGASRCSSFNGCEIRDCVGLFSAPDASRFSVLATVLLFIRAVMSLSLKLTPIAVSGPAAAAARLTIWLLYSSASVIRSTVHLLYSICLTLSPICNTVRIDRKFRWLTNVCADIPEIFKHAYVDYVSFEKNYRLIQFASLLPVQ
jgi:hypothetical protein